MSCKPAIYISMYLGWAKVPLPASRFLLHSLPLLKQVCFELDDRLPLVHVIICIYDDLGSR